MAGRREGSSPTSTERNLLFEATRVAAAHDLIGMFGHLSYYPEHSGDRRYLLSPGAELA